MRTYKRKLGTRRHKNYNPADFEKAVAAVKAGAQVKATAIKYKVPRTTLSDRVHNLHLQEVGRPLAIELHIEKKFQQVLSVAAEWGFPLEIEELQDFVQDYLNKNNINVAVFKDNRPGTGWVRLFLQRSKKELSFQPPNHIKKGRSKVSHEAINMFFDNIGQSMSAIPAMNVVNYDETSVQDDPGKKKVICKKGRRHSDRILDSTKSAFSVMCSVSGDGSFLAPYTVYKAKHLYDTWTQYGPQGGRYAATESGWFEKRTFEDWFFQIVLPYFKKVPNDQPRILIGDNVASHLSYDVIKACKANNIKCVLLPPNSTHLTQPLDVAVSKSFKNKWKAGRKSIVEASRKLRFHLY